MSSTVGDEGDGLRGRDQGKPYSTEPVIGYRLWWCDADGNLLSLNSRKPWDNRAWTRAWCYVNPLTSYGDVPGEGCSCGLYAFKTLDMLSRAMCVLLEPAPDDPTWGVIGGAVQLAGKVIEHDLGYRAERARICEIHPIYGFDLEATAAGRRLQVPVSEPFGPYEEIIGQIRELRRLHGPRRST